MSRLSRLLLAVTASVAIAASPAAGAQDKKLPVTLGDMWTTVLQTPAPTNPFTGGNPCIDLGGNVVAPFAGGATFTCTVKPGTKLFIAGQSSECSTVEPPPFHGTDEDSLRQCARDADAAAGTPTVTFDGSPVALTETTTGLLNFVLPADNILGAPAGTEGQSVAHGWVAVRHPLPLGTHVIRIELGGTLVNTTTIQVRPGA
jgi:hypothetical protein